MSTEIELHADPDVLADAVAARLVTTLVDAQSARGHASVVLTGGGTGIAILERLRAHPDRDTVDWAQVDVYWGDERFLPAGDGERNETQARAALLDHVPVDPARVFAMPASDVGLAVDAAAEVYADVLAARGYEGSAVPRFDVLLLGMGPEGHVASIFPDSPAVHESSRTVVGVRDCPKPPPTRVSLTLGAIRAAAEVWLCVTGEGKADAVRTGVGGDGEVALPAAGARGALGTRWILDRAAASALPHDHLPSST